MNGKNKRKDTVPEMEVVSRQEYQEILLAKMAGGDLYANEQRLKIRRVDRMLDIFREEPIYKKYYLKFQL